MDKSGRAWDRLGAFARPRGPSPLSWRELGIAALAFLALSIVFYGWYAFHGGFVADDWLNSAKYQFHPEPGFWGAVANYQTPSRPVAAVYVSLTYAILGNHFHWHLVLSVLLAGFISVAFFAFLREVGLSLVLAFAVAAMLLVFPSSDSTRFWTTGSQINLFIGLYLTAVTIALAGRRRYGPAPTSRAVAVQALASALAVTAVAGYEIVAPAVLLSVFVYGAVEKAGAVWRWLMDAVPTLVVLLTYTLTFNGGPAPASALPANARTVADGALSVLGYTLVPLRSEPRWLVVGGVVAVLLAIAAVWRLAPAGPNRDSIVRWLRPILLAIVATAIGYAMIVPAAERYPIYVPGVQNRTNCLAALGLSALAVFVLAALASILVAAVPNLSQRSRTLLRRGLAGALVLGLFTVWAVRINEDRHRWQDAATLQAQIVSATQRLVPSPPPDATVFTSPYPGFSAPSIPIFAGGGNNDEVSAFIVLYGEPELRGFPLLTGVGIECNRTNAATPDAGNSETEYGKGIFVDLRTETVYRPQNRAQCLAVTKRMEPFGDVNREEGW